MGCKDMDSPAQKLCILRAKVLKGQTSFLGGEEGEEEGRGRGSVRASTCCFWLNFKNNVSNKKEGLFSLDTTKKSQNGFKL